MSVKVSSSLWLWNPPDSKKNEEEKNWVIAGDLFPFLLKSLPLCPALKNLVKEVKKGIQWYVVCPRLYSLYSLNTCSVCFFCKPQTPQSLTSSVGYRMKKVPCLLQRPHSVCIPRDTANIQAQVHHWSSWLLEKENRPTEVWPGNRQRGEMCSLLGFTTVLLDLSPWKTTHNGPGLLTAVLWSLSSHC